MSGARRRGAGLGRPSSGGRTGWPTSPCPCTNRPGMKSRRFRCRRRWSIPIQRAARSGLIRRPAQSVEPRSPQTMPDLQDCDAETPASIPVGLHYALCLTPRTGNWRPVGRCARRDVAQPFSPRLPGSHGGRWEAQAARRSCPISHASCRCPRRTAGCIASSCERAFATRTDAGSGRRRAGLVRAHAETQWPQPAALLLRDQGRVAMRHPATSVRPLERHPDRRCHQQRDVQPDQPSTTHMVDSREGPVLWSTSRTSGRLTRASNRFDSSCGGYSA